MNTEGTQEGNGIVLQNGTQFAETALIFPNEIEFPDWESLGGMLGTVVKASPWWVGDWIIYGENRFGEMYSQALDQTGLDYGTLRNYAWMSRKFPAQTRNPNLTWGHHRAMASLDLELHSEMIELAIEEDLTVKQLEDKIAEKKRDRDAEDFVGKTEAPRYAGGQWEHDSVFVADIRDDDLLWPENEVDLILCDLFQFEGEDFEEAIGSLFRLGQRILRTGGFLIPRIRHIDTAATFRKSNLWADMIYHFWTISERLSVIRPVDSRKCRNHWTMFPVFVKQGDMDGNWWFDDEIREHRVGDVDSPIQTYREIVDSFCPIGGLVFDPFCYNGDVGIATLIGRQRRTFILCDPLESSVVLAQDRINRTRIEWNISKHGQEDTEEEDVKISRSYSINGVDTDDPADIERIEEMIGEETVE